MSRKRKSIHEVYKRPRRLKAGAEVRGHRLCALSVIPDPKDGEIMVNILGCFDTYEDATEWVNDVCSKSQSSHDVYIHETCEWIFPNGVTESIKKETYRNSELQKIMDAAKANPKNVRSFKEWKKDQDSKKLDDMKKEMKERRLRASENKEQSSEEIMTDSELEAHFRSCESEFGIDLTSRN